MPQLPGPSARTRLLPSRAAIPVVGVVVCPPQRPATPYDVWIELLAVGAVALQDVLVIDSPRQQLLGIVVDMERVSTAHGTPPRRSDHGDETIRARLRIVSASDGRRRPPEGTAVRWPRADEVAELLAEARQIPPEQRVPLAVLPLPATLAPVYGDLERIAGPTATSILITGMAGSLKTTAGVLALRGVQLATGGQAALVLVNSKGNDLLFPDYSRQTWAERLPLRPLRSHDVAIYATLGYPDPPVLGPLTAFVPQTTDGSWQSARPLAFPRTAGYQLSQDVAIRYACAPTDDDERPASVVTRQCIDEAATAFAREQGIATLDQLVWALERELLALSGDRARWRNQFQATTLASAVRQLHATFRDLGPLLAPRAAPFTFPVEQLACGGTWVVDVAPLPPQAAQAVLDALIEALHTAKATGVLPPNLPLVLLVDELNRWATRGPTAARLAGIVRDQRHRRFSVVALAQQLSTLHPHLLANADTLWLGSTRPQELADDAYDHLPPHLRSQLHRLPPGQRLLDMWPLAQPLIVEVPFPSWLIADEGLLVVNAWRARQREEG